MFIYPLSTSSFPEADFIAAIFPAIPQINKKTYNASPINFNITN